MDQLTIYDFDSRQTGGKVVQVHVPPLPGKPVEEHRHGIRGDHIAWIEGVIVTNVHDCK